MDYEESGESKNLGIADGIAPDCGRGLRVLVAEDDSVTRRLVTRLLEKHGFTVMATTNGKEAVSAHEKETFDLVLMDIQMPELNGIEATTAIRTKETSNSKHTPVVAMTALEGDHTQFINAGMDSYVHKPFEPKTLLDIINNSVPLKNGWIWTGKDTATPAPPIDWEQAIDQAQGDQQLLNETLEWFMKNARD